jgi:predicted small integral membrane protein
LDLETNGIRAHLAMMKGKTLFWDRVPPGCRPRTGRIRFAAALRERAA